MSIGKLSRLLALLALLCAPFAMVSCDDDHWHGDDYWHGGYPDNGGSESEADQMVSLLCGYWKGDMYYSYTDETAKPGAPKRVTEKYAVEMTFYRSEDGKDRYAGRGVEVDRDDHGNTQALNYTWWIDTANGDIYLKYTDSGTIFRMDAASSNRGYRLGWETSRNAYTFFGYLIGQSNDDEIYIDLERSETSRKVLSVSNQSTVSVFSFGKADENAASYLQVNAASRLRRR